MESTSDQVAKIDVGYEIPTWNNWSPLAKFYHPLQAGSIDGTDTAPHDRAVTRALEAKCKWNYSGFTATFCDVVVLLQTCSLHLSFA